MLLGLLRAAKPSHAYEISGVLVKRDQAPQFGVTVQVLRRPDQGAAPDTTYDVSWERAVRRAADRALAEIVPRTRHCAPPWAAWRGFAMPPDLIEAYEDAVELETGREYERALDRFYDALDDDPMNLVLRLHIGQLQEKLGLYLDALATYEGMVEVTTRARGPARRLLPPRGRQGARGGAGDRALPPRRAARRPGARQAVVRDRPASAGAGPSVTSSARACATGCASAS